MSGVQYSLFSVNNNWQKGEKPPANRLSYNMAVVNNNEVSDTVHRPK